jgi:hypothetical protein
MSDTGSVTAVPSGRASAIVRSRSSSFTAPHPRRSYSVMAREAIGVASTPTSCESSVTTAVTALRAGMGFFRWREVSV